MSKIYNWCDSEEEGGEAVIYSRDHEGNVEKVGEYSYEEVWDVLIALEKLESGE